MERLSRVLLNTVSLSLDAVFGASDADVRVHGVENIPDGPVLFLFNHFTRMETFFVPYILYKHTKKYAISLAHHSFFGGGFGRFLERLGAVSTKDPDLDRIFMGNLLSGKNSVVVYPEGQMIKDKKIVEKGKFMVYNAGMRRPPHTGAARMALRSELYRQKLKHFLELGFYEEIEQYKKYFNIADEDLNRVVSQETSIVPVNITYYPIRARNNAIQKLAERFVKNMGDRFEEELQVEGTMIIEGVDIDMNFGKPIGIRDFVLRKRKNRKAIKDRRLYLYKEEMSETDIFSTSSVELMQMYMKAIYTMTTVNHDHIFSFLLTKYTRKKIPEQDLKNRAYLAIDALKRSSVTNHHTSLEMDQLHLLTDDIHEKYTSFIKTAMSDGLIAVKNGYIIKNMDRFKRLYQFHTIRRDNIVEVMMNEIEPLSDLSRDLNMIMRLPSFMVRRIIMKRFLALDQRLFKEDYAKYYIEGESKPKKIGSPFFLKRPCNRKGIILIHGMLSAPEEIRVLAEYLHKKGYAVYGTRLRGHGTAPEDLARSSWEEWYDSVSRAYIILKNSVSDIAIGGFSTGGCLSLLHAANSGARFKGVVSINAPLKLMDIKTRFSSTVEFWNRFLERMKVTTGRMEFVKNNPDNPHINYLRIPIHGISELGRLMNTVTEKLPLVYIPSLIIQGSNDPVVNPVSAREIYENLGARDKEMWTLFAEKHGIVRGEQSEQVAEKVANFLERIFSETVSSS